MWLVNFPKVRIKKFEEGYVVQIQKKTWYGRKYWTHIESVAGMHDTPWCYETYDNALDNAQKHFRWELMHGTQFF